MSQILEDLRGVICHMDDILIHAADQEEHGKRVRAILGRIQEAGLTLNTIKCQFSRSSLTFLGHIIDGSGIQADPQKTTAVKKLSDSNYGQRATKGHGYGKPNGEINPRTGRVHFSE